MYDSYYGYSQPPFRLSPDPSFFYGSKGHNRALAYLRYGLTQKEGFIVVTGTPGTGKTTIARALLQEMGNERIVVSEVNTTHLQADDVLRMVAASYGLEQENASKATLLNRLENFFLAKYRAGYHCLLMIDESQNLPFESLEELRMLSNFYQGNHALVQIFLLGQEQFRDMLYLPKFEQLRQRVVAATHLEALSARDTRDYIVHRLKTVGWDGTNPAISKRSFAHIYALTKGIPRRINTFCDRLFLYASLEELDTIDDKIVQEVAKELMFEGTGKPGSEKDSIRMDFTDSEAAEMLEEDDEAVSVDEVKATEKDSSSHQEKMVEKTDKQESLALPPVKPKPNLTLIDGNRAVKKAEEPQPVPKSSEPEEQAPEEWVASLAIMHEVYQHQDVNRLSAYGDDYFLEGMPELFEYANSQRSLPPGARAIASEDQLKEAIVYYVRNVLLTNSADYYRRLGVRHDANDETIKRHYQHLFKLFQPAPGQTREHWDKSLVLRVNQAYATLRDETKRKAYDIFLRDLEADDGRLPEEVAKVEPQQNTTQKPVAEASTDSSNRSGKGSPVALIIVLLLVVLGAVAGGLYYLNPQLLGFEATEKTAQAEPENNVKRFDSAPVKDDQTNVVDIPPIAQPIEKGIAPKNPLAVKTPEPAKVVKQQVKPKPVKLAPVDVTTASKAALPSKDVPKKPVVKTTKPVNPSEPKQVKKPQPKVVAKAETKPVKEKIEPAPVKVTKAELSDLMQRFALTYEEGNVDSFMTLFANNAATNDQLGKSGIRKDYKALFGSTEMRVIEVTNLNWNIKNNEARGKGDFVVTILLNKSKNMRRITGTMSFSVVKQSNGKLLFNEMMHSYSANN